MKVYSLQHLLVVVEKKETAYVKRVKRFSYAKRNKI